MRYTIVIAALAMVYSPMIFAEEMPQKNQTEAGSDLPDLTSDLVDQQNPDENEQSEAEQQSGVVQKNFNEVIDDDTTLRGGAPKGGFGLTLERDF